MIASVTGVVKFISFNSVVIEVGGVGISVNVPARAITEFKLEQKIELFTSLIVREDSLTLYGFESQSGKELFELLQTVTGIGPKVALSALSVFEVSVLQEAIAGSDKKALERIPGLGKKGAERLVLELKDKMHLGSSIKNRSGWRPPLSSALSGLGFNAKEVDLVLDQLAKELGEGIANLSSSNLLKEALKIKANR